MRSDCYGDRYDGPECRGVYSDNVYYDIIQRMDKEISMLKMQIRDMEKNKDDIDKQSNETYINKIDRMIKESEERIMERVKCILAG